MNADTFGYPLRFFVLFAVQNGFRLDSMIGMAFVDGLRPIKKAAVRKTPAAGQTGKKGGAIPPVRSKGVFRWQHAAAAIEETFALGLP